MTPQQKQAAADIASGKLIEGISKEQRENEENETGQQGKRNKKESNKAKPASDKLTPELDTIMMFGRLGLSPPVKKDELENIIK